jgi:hypothetical protein
MLNPSTAQITIFETYKCSIHDYDEDGVPNEEVKSDDPEQAFIEATRKAYLRIVGFSLDSTSIDRIRVYQLGDRSIFEETILSFTRQEVNVIRSKFRDEIIILGRQRAERMKADELRRTQEWKESREKKEKEIFKTLKAKYES